MRAQLASAGTDGGGLPGVDLERATPGKQKAATWAAAAAGVSYQTLRLGLRGLARSGITSRINQVRAAADPASP